MHSIQKNGYVCQRKRYERLQWHRKKQLAFPREKKPKFFRHGIHAKAKQYNYTNYRQTKISAEMSRIVWTFQAAHLLNENSLILVFIVKRELVNLMANYVQMQLEARRRMWRSEITKPFFEIIASNYNNATQFSLDASSIYLCRGSHLFRSIVNNIYGDV